MFLCGCYLFFFLKQKTAYGVRISDWSSDVCSSDLVQVDGHCRLEDIGLGDDEGGFQPAVRLPRQAEAILVDDAGGHRCLDAGQNVEHGRGAEFGGLRDDLWAQHGIPLSRVFGGVRVDISLQAGIAVEVEAAGDLFEDFSDGRECLSYLCLP